jgi:hypothetical protein
VIGHVSFRLTVGWLLVIGCWRLAGGGIGGWWCVCVVAQLLFGKNEANLGRRVGGGRGVGRKRTSA